MSLHLQYSVVAFDINVPTCTLHTFGTALCIYLFI